MKTLETQDIQCQQAFPSPTSSYELGLWPCSPCLCAAQSEESELATGRAYTRGEMGKQWLGRGKACCSLASGGRNDKQRTEHGVNDPFLNIVF